MKKTLLLLLLPEVAAFATAAQMPVALPPLPELRVPHAARAFVIDGLWGDKWRTSASLPLREFWVREEPADANTEVRACYDDRYLYVGFLCADDDIVAERTAADDQTYRDDCVEVFLARDTERLADALGLEVSATGAVADYYYRHSDWFNYGWDSFVVVKTSRVSVADGRAGYVMEMAIPWKTVLPALGLGERPGALRANFGRWDQSHENTPHGVYSLWSYSGMSFPSPHRPERYGRLIFDADVTANPLTLPAR